MTERMNTDPNEVKTPQPAAAANESAVDAAAAPQEPAPRHVDDMIADLRREASDLKDKYLRAHAEIENLRKRNERDLEDAKKYAVSRFARDLLNVGDNMQRALAALPAGAADSDPAFKSLADGVAMTEREFQAVLERNGVKRIDPIGERFDPHVHQAVMQMPNADVPEGTIVQVFQPGYLIEERTLRPAMVVVSTGPAAKPSVVDDLTEPEPPPAAG
jgi:molecular chaperone GrpE